MDIKNSKERYNETVGIDKFDISLMEKSVEILMNSDVQFEFRTTVTKNFHTVEDIEKHIDESKYPGYKEKLIALKKENPDLFYSLRFESRNILFALLGAMHSTSWSASKKHVKSYRTNDIRRNLGSFFVC